MNDSRSLQEAVDAIFNVLENNRIHGRDFDLIGLRERAQSVGRYEKDIFYGKWDRGWAAECNLQARIVISQDRNGNPTWELECKVSWSSSGRSLVSATVASTLYREVIELGCMLENEWSRWNVRREVQE